MIEKEKIIEKLAKIDFSLPVVVATNVQIVGVKILNRIIFLKRKFFVSVKNLLKNIG